jgi:hypothetical protein
MSDDARPDATRPDEGAARRRGIILATSLAAAAVMGGVVWAAVRARESEPPRASHADGLANRPPEIRPAPGALRAPIPMTGVCAADPDHPPRLVLEPAKVDFGTVKQGVVIERHVRITNGGEGTLCIPRVDSGCGCIQATLLGSRELRPGDEARLTITLDSTGRANVQRKHVHLFTNDPAALSYGLEVTADVNQGLIAGSARVEFGRRVRGQPATATVVLYSPKEDPAWTVSGVRGATPRNGAPVDYTFTVREVPSPDRRAVEVMITHPGRAEQGGFSDSISLRTTHPDRPEVVVRAYMEVVAPILASPSRASLGFVPAPRASVRLTPGQRDIAFRVTGTRFVDSRRRKGGVEEPLGDDVPFEVEVRAEQGGTWTLVVGYDDEEREPGTLESTLVVETDRAEMREVRIPVTATVIDRRPR